MIVDKIYDWLGDTMDNIEKAIMKPIEKIHSIGVDVDWYDDYMTKAAELVPKYRGELKGIIDELPEEYSDYRKGREAINTLIFDTKPVIQDDEGNLKYNKSLDELYQIRWLNYGELYDLVMTEPVHEKAPKAAPPQMQYLTPQQAKELAALQQAYNQQVGAEV